MGRPLVSAFLALSLDGGRPEDVRRLPSGLIQAVYRPYPPGAGHHAPGTAT